MSLLPFLANKLAKKNQDLNLCESFLLSFKMGEIDQGIFIECLLFSGRWRGCRRLKTWAPWPQGPSKTVEDTKQTPCLIQATTYSFI